METSTTKRILSPNFSCRFKLYDGILNEFEENSEYIKEELLIDEVVEYRYARTKEVLFDENVGYKYIPIDYEPNKYKVVKKYQVKYIDFNCNSQELARFDKRLKLYLKEGSKSTANSVIEEQANNLFYFLTVSKPASFLQKKYRIDRRTETINFYERLNNFIKHIELAEKTGDIKIKFKTSENASNSSKEFKLPNSLEGNIHFLTAMKKFLYDYYRENPPIKYLQINELLDDNLVKERAKKITNRKSILNLQLIDKYYLTFHLNLLQMIKKFPQFSKKQRGNAGISEKQARFLLKFLILINYKRYIQDGFPISPDFTVFENYELSKKVKGLRNELTTFSKQLKSDRYFSL